MQLEERQGYYVMISRTLGNLSRDRGPRTHAKFGELFEDLRGMFSQSNEVLLSLLSQYAVKKSCNLESGNGSKSHILAAPTKSDLFWVE